MKIIITTIYLLFITTITQAQEDIVKEIRNQYNEYNEQAKLSTNEGITHLPLRFTITTSQMQRAIGPVNINTTIFYDEMEIEPQNGENTNYKYKRTIRKITVNYQMAGKLYKEYFFDTDGFLIFFYLHDEQWQMIEERYYFNKNELIKVIHTNLPEKTDEALPNYTHTGKSITEDDLNNVSKIFKSAGAFENLLDKYSKTNPQNVDYY